MVIELFVEVVRHNVTPYEATKMDLSLEKRSLKRDLFFDKFKKKEITDEDISEVFHENTKVGYSKRLLRESVEPFQQSDKEWFSARAEKTDLPLIELPEAEKPNESFVGTLEKRRSVRWFEKTQLSINKLSTLLKYGCGTNQNNEELTVNARVYPSAGKLYPIEPYLLISNVDGLDPGAYYYSPPNHGLRRLDKLSHEEVIKKREAITPTWSYDLNNPHVQLILTGLFWKSKMKYGPRGYRFAVLEAGHLMQNIQLVACALGLGTCSLGALDETKVDPFLGNNGVDESALYGSFIGTPASQEANNGH